MKKTILTAALSAAILCLLAAPGYAQHSAKAASMTSAQVTEKLKAAGYTDIHGIEKEGKHFDADAMKDGKAVHLHVDARTGDIAVANDESEENEKHEHDEAAEHEQHKP